MSKSLKESLRIVGVIAAKDIQDAIKNKTTLSIMFGALFMMVSGMALPLLAGLRQIPTAIIYDPDKSTLIKALTTRDEFRLGLVESEEELEEILTASLSDNLGLVIPPGFRQAAEAGGVLEIDGYYAHWSDPDKIAENVMFFEEQLSQASWQKVRIHTEGHAVYPTADQDGWPFMVSLLWTLMILVIGLAIVPYLLVEEKEERTIDALMVSPARYSQVIAGKGLVGAFYCLLAAGIIFLANARIFVHWEVAILASILGVAFAVSVGLLLGSIFDNPASVNMWMGLVLLGLIVLTFLEALNSPRVPGIIKAIASWNPATALVKVLKLSMAWEIPMGMLWQNVAVLGLSTLVIYLLIIWRIRRMENS